MQQIVKHKWWIFAGFVLVAALSRLLPHPYNFTPIGGMALFAGGMLSNRKFYWIVPLIAYWISDLLVMNFLYAGFYDAFMWWGQPMVYVSIFLIVIVGKFLLNKISLPRLIGGSLAASIIFFLVSNFGVWMSGMGYPLTWEGLVACYAAAIPFFQNTLAGDLFYVTVLFGSYVAITSYFPAWRLKTQKA